MNQCFMSGSHYTMQTYYDNHVKEKFINARQNVYDAIILHNLFIDWRYAGEKEIFHLISREMIAVILIFIIIIIFPNTFIQG